MSAPAKPPSESASTPQSMEANARTNAHEDGAAGCVVAFVEPSGNTRDVPVLQGQSLMDAALVAGVDGIVGQCGGAINCATCLCDFAADQLAQLPAQHPDERELLHYVDEASTNSRLTCQLTGQPALQGMVARVVVSIGSSAD